MSLKLQLCGGHFVAVLLATLLAGVIHLAAQGTTATILGTVTDASGAAVSEAAIQVRNVGTGATQTTTTDGQGRFNISNLAIGDYEVQASKAAFSTVVH